MLGFWQLEGYHGKEPLYPALFMPVVGVYAQALLLSLLSLGWADVAEKPEQSSRYLV